MTHGLIERMPVLACVTGTKATGGYAYMKVKAGTPVRSATSAGSDFHSPCLSSLPHSVLPSSLLFLLNGRQALHVLACSSVTRSVSVI